MRYSEEKNMNCSEALAVLQDALGRCRGEDMRTPEVFTALNLFAARAEPQWLFEQVRNAVDSNNEEGRYQNLNASLNAIRSPSFPGRPDHPFCR
jgi:hypothetical protein